ncbi:tyrosinase family oxidase copper chaperone [Streptomyces sp. NPDC046805]|uniref:tyrosinase family oxidase copper chaperone n=1 Tax=Streptomyces sp. NPDC046805 TaxID=3155134 RepID=UPI0033FED061
MVVSIGGAPVGSGSQGRGGPEGRTRREVARGLLASAAALAVTSVVGASRPRSREVEAGSGPFDETYHGRRIRGFPIPVGERVTDGAEWEVTVDGRPLPLMRRADGTWLSMIDHYSSYRTPREAARAAVDELGTQRLRDPAPEPVGGHPQIGGPYGVRA